MDGEQKKSILTLILKKLTTTNKDSNLEAVAGKREEVRMTLEQS